MKNNPVLLPADWHEYEKLHGVDENRPGIYLWTIDGVDSYIGKYTHISRPRKEYGRNVTKLLNGLPYRPQPGKTDGFRRIHRALAHAHTHGQPIRLTILTNVEPHELNARERQLILERKTTLNGPERRG